MKVFFTTFTALVLALLVSGCERADGPTSESAAPIASEPAARKTDTASESHDAHAEHGPAPVLAEGQLWPTDTPLRAAMTRIRTAVEERSPAYEQGKLQAADAQALASAVEKDVSYMVENCKLEPEPDAALHVLIGRLMSAAAALRADPASAAGLPQVSAVLHDYQATFDHPGWTQRADEH